MANSTPEPVPATLSTLRRRLITAGPDAAAKAETVDFEFLAGSDLVFRDLEQVARSSSPPGYDEVEALLQRYQAEKVNVPLEAPPPVAPVEQRRSNGLPELRLPPGVVQARAASQRASTSNSVNTELERLRTENTELRQLVEQYREVVVGHDPAVWEQKVADAEQLIAERDEQVQQLGKQIEEWEEKFKTHRFVPCDDELSVMADELEKERVNLAQERKQLDEAREQLKQDEDDLMKQMREMEVSMAKDRADLARQRTELQRLHGEIKHELEMMERGDASLKERMSQFQRRYHDAVTRPSGPPLTGAGPTQPTPMPVPAPPSPTTGTPRESGVFKKLFGQGR